MQTRTQIRKYVITHDTALYSPSTIPNVTGLVAGTGGLGKETVVSGYIENKVKAGFSAPSPFLHITDSPYPKTIGTYAPAKSYAIWGGTNTSGSSNADGNSQSDNTVTMKYLLTKDSLVYILTSTGLKKTSPIQMLKKGTVVSGSRIKSNANQNYPVLLQMMTGRVVDYRNVKPIYSNSIDKITMSSANGLASDMKKITMSSADGSTTTTTSNSSTHDYSLNKSGKSIISGILVGIIGFGVGKSIGKGHVAIWTGVGALAGFWIANALSDNDAVAKETTPQTGSKKSSSTDESSSITGSATINKLNCTNVGGYWVYNAVTHEYECKGSGGEFGVYGVNKGKLKHTDGFSAVQRNLRTTVHS